MTANAQYRLAARPVGLPKPTDWQYTEEPVGEPGDGQFLVENQYVSLDPAMRGWMNAGKSYLPPVGIGEVMRAAAVGTVVSSKHPDFAEGDIVHGVFGVQKYAISDGKGVSKVDTSLAPAPMHLGTLGNTGFTAYFGLLDVGKPEAGQTVVVSAAAGAVGSIAGQIAKIKGCRTIGIAGGPEKCKLLVEEFGFDAAIDYKAGDIRGQLKEHAPNGVDVYFDNVGGEILEAVLARLTRGARVVISGAVSQYNSETPPSGPANYMQLLVARASMTGFLVFDYAARYPEATADLAKWLQEGRITSRETIVDGGIAAFPETLNGLFAGKNTGKLILAV
ncbi:NADP-dependent oxidoreductase [Kibdelosporangium philippinense]|uniref:NADP-dependent oxidoreductase n=1 Tax=Kibdelosporangium philippinense TaxID=211113 RepID=A0ABS8Z7R9_9PSEU|nr:NADP-dependent oxidoreductase [Kibdelosporangium philippinense]MCE7003930.1 NADP-dependent oxidoreductase [Kibdelosporangium philippinense]